MEGGPEHLTTSIEIYHPVFAKFREFYESRSDIHSDDIMPLRKLAEHCLMLSHTREPIRNSELRRLFKDFLGGNVTSTPNEDRTVPDGNIWFKTGPAGEAIGLILERKNEWADCDPYKQSVLSAVRAYQEMSKQVGYCKVHLYWIIQHFQQNSEILQSSCTPCFLITSAGPFWSISGCIYTDKVVAQGLTPTFWIGWTHIEDDVNFFQAVRYFVALKKSLISLREFYQGLQPTRALEPFLPHPRFYHDANGDKVTFEYVQYMQDPDICQTFLAKARGRKVVVKFVSR